ncbi:fluoride efflux transporter CrcB [Sporolactobacillus shoreae]|uniref:Fluoride-specific ion channel FluC n=1 Tax=Sporolactobacillus shoreae TaxID=1465501 RepID=A0A4Z0GPE8_9BACL|nr:CrcB family protein [Sporolactobacillus shoreae]TGA98878.1 fluoride efflux transporter CrcB [Sporolactobacillus shoreae]
MIINYLLVGVGAGFGVLARVLTTQWIMQKWSSPFPLATFLINMSGSLLLGLLTGLSIGAHFSLLLGTGFLGAYTTFSTFNVENVELLRRKKYRTLISYAGGSYLFGILAASAGLALGSIL